MAFKPTPQQQAAIDAPHNRNAVVTAAAGSGKTTLLVDRILRLISDPELDIPADTLAIMTFTRNAAAALRTKLNDGIAKRIRELPKNDSTRKYLSDQAIALRAASIGTIDSFCINILKENVHAFGLPMNFSIADDARVSSMKNLAMKSTLAYFYEHDEGDSCPDGDISAEERRVLFFTFSFEDDRQLQDCINAVFEKFASYADREEWLDRCVGLYEDFDRMSDIFAPANLGMIKNCLDKATLRLSLIESIVNDYANEKQERGKSWKQEVLVAMNEYFNGCQKLVDDTTKAFEALSADPTAANFTRFFEELGEAPNFSERKDPQSPAKKCLTAAKKGFTLASDLRAMAFFDSEERPIFPQQQTAVKTFVKLLRHFSESYRSIMHTNGTLDFAECEYLLLERLREDETLRSQLSERYSCIIVDEFQDSNDVQAEMFRLISNGKNNLFYVGDVKQSIYGFRGGNPLIMGRLINKPSALGRLCASAGKLTVSPSESGKVRVKVSLAGKNPTAYLNRSQRFKVLPLTKNFRSRKAVVDTVNTIFSGVMTQKYGGVDYANGAALVLGSNAFYQPVSDPDKYKTEILLVESAVKSDAAKKETQAKIIADRINELIAEGFLVTGKDGKLRPCGFGDFAVLMRGNSDMGLFKEVFAKNGIPSVLPKNTEFLTSEEIALTLDLLRVIDNPMRDEEMLRVLMSPLFGFTADETAQLKLGTLGFPLEEIEDDLSPIAGMMKSRTLFGCLSFCCREEDPEYDRESVSEKASDALALINILNSSEKTARRISEKAQRFLKCLEKLRTFMSNNAVDELIRFACDETEIYNVIATYENSRQRLANVRLLQKYAADFENADGGTLSDFLRFLGGLESSSLNAANVPEDVSNAVKLMTFHASKGLEMPVCILAEMNTPINKQDSFQPVLLSHKYGIAMKYVDNRERFSVQPLAYNTFSRIIAEGAYSDELRLLYVAATRPMDKLIITAEAADSLQGLKLPKDATPVSVFSDGKPINWILRSLFRNVSENTLSAFDADRSKPLSIGDFAEVVAVKPPVAKAETDDEDKVSEDDIIEEEEFEEEFSEEELFEDELEEDMSEVWELAQEISEKLNVKYPHAAETRLQAKYAVTELAHSSMDSTTDKIVYFNLPSFAKNAKMAGNKVGDAYHHFMEHCRLEVIRDSADISDTIREMIAELCEEQLISEDERDILLSREGFVRNLAGFFESGLGKRVLSDISRVRREQPFRAEVPAQRLGVKGRDGADSSALISIQGRTDMYFYEDDGIVLVDYKSDTRANLAKELDNYCKQLMTYKEILPQVTGVPVKQVLIYGFSVGQVIDCEKPWEIFEQNRSETDED